VKYQIRLSGSGGQGLILGSILLSEAASKEGKKVLQSQAYGPASRGGSSRADVIIADEEIYYPSAESLELLLCLTQEAADKYITMLKSDGILIFDSSNVKINPIKAETIAIPFTQIAIDKLKTSLVANIIAIAFIATLTELISLKELKKAIKNNIKEKFIDLDIKAAELGVKLAKEYKNGKVIKT